MTNIQWTDKTINPIVGCSRISAGCVNCYAINQAMRNETMGKGLIKQGKNAGRLTSYFGLTEKRGNSYNWTGKVNFVPEALDEVFKRKKPTVWFVNSMSDLSHESVLFEWIDQIMAAIALNPHHAFQVLTKQPERMLEYFREFDNSQRCLELAATIVRNAPNGISYETNRRLGYILDPKGGHSSSIFPLPNLWLGVSVENQKEADKRIPCLLKIPAAVRFLSCEPLLEEIDLTCCDYNHDWQDCGGVEHFGCWNHFKNDFNHPIDWVILGGESGINARPFHLEWAESLIKQCQENGVKVFFKQAGRNPYYKGQPLKLKSRKGDDLGKLPEFCNIQEMPSMLR